MDQAPSGPAAGTEREDALSEVLGAIAYALLRVFQLSAAATGTAPTISLRERQAAFAVEEFDRFRVIRRRLAALSPHPEAAMERFRGPLDAYYETASVGAWLDAQVFHFVGEAITTDFAELLAARVDDRSGQAVREALAGRGAHTAFALEQVRTALVSGGGDVQDRVRAVAGSVVGSALTHLREAVLESDALATVLGGEDEVKEMVLEILGRHRERLERLGLDHLD